VKPTKGSTVKTTLIGDAAALRSGYERRTFVRLSGGKPGYYRRVEILGCVTMTRDSSYATRGEKVLVGRRWKTNRQAWGKPFRFLDESIAEMVSGWEIALIEERAKQAKLAKVGK
jgi:hypothetical protein